MSAIDTLFKIMNNENLISYPFKYCLVSNNKIPYTFTGAVAHPNKVEDFCDLEDLVSCEKLNLYQGIGISIIGSNICAIDVDKCFSIPFDINSGDDRAKDIIEMFKDKAYIEFSFSGKGLRILFNSKTVDNYIEQYYIKNEKTGIEYYQPTGTARYVTLTGETIYDNDLFKIDSLDIIYIFLNKYMLRPKKINIDKSTNSSSINNDLSIEELRKKIKSLYLRDIEFQNLWFGQAPGSNSNESEMDFHLLSILYSKITTDKDKLKELFELSPYFKSKDQKHLNKWIYGNYRYYNYIYERLG